MMASIHTTAHVTLANLLDKPQYKPDIIQEMKDCFEESGAAVTRSEIENLRRMDSFIKETARFSPVALSK